ncbi:unnamed protein product [Rotaria magnacalcarata]|uniref:Ketoreductase domain-containing protein n=1 Tax=Rotaria magnacalcarata TaxID=392030 RepID=A0A815YS39_9BILA|nr:unnamed protein product [Rotaria magnacalcarata]CAF1576353.1 unnamed protein product [Rotaria magnacalcarata]CAF2016588.1 unnamed protein product [Rotaria magnacalcarata]CAF4181242.1 unnamed protein product [Rotaria magnacalcarata]CAF4988900.1 unnamed protein product [Rotaria magnacalcarata]
MDEASDNQVNATHTLNKTVSNVVTGRFKDKTAIVTGAGSGIGRAIVLRLVSEGASILAIDINEIGLQETVTLSSNPDGVSIAVASITDEQQVTEKINEYVARQGHLDILINMAAILRSSISIDTTVEEFKAVIDTNLIGTFILCRACLPHLVVTKGNIVNAASVAGLHGHAYMAAYSASKGAIIALTKSLAREFIIQGVRVNAVAPGGTLTPLVTTLQLPEGINLSLLDNIQQPGQRLGLPEEIAAVVAMLASQDGSFINGEVIRIDGGLHT